MEGRLALNGKDLLNKKERGKKHSVAWFDSKSSHSLPQLSLQQYFSQDVGYCTHQLQGKEKRSTIISALISHPCKSGDHGSRSAGSQNNGIRGWMTFCSCNGPASLFCLCRAGEEMGISSPDPSAGLKVRGEAP